MRALKSHVRNGHFVIEESTDLAEGTDVVLELVKVADAFTDMERNELEQAIEEGFRDFENGDHVGARSVGYAPDGLTPTCSNAASGSPPKCWLGLIYVRTACADTNSEIACANAEPQNPAETVSFAVTANATYNAFVDGYEGQDYSYGPFNLRITVQ
jgi:hypothetical protein